MNYHVPVQEFFHGFKRMVALVTVFFMPELVEMIGDNVLFNSKFVKKVFWSAMETREQSGQKRGDFIDSLITLKNGEQNPDYSELQKFINKFYYHYYQDTNEYN